MSSFCVRHRPRYCHYSGSRWTLLQRWWDVADGGCLGPEADSCVESPYPSMVVGVTLWCLKTKNLHLSNSPYAEQSCLSDRIQQPETNCVAS